MPDLSCNQAAAALLHALGFAATIDADGETGTLPELLRGCGLAAERVALIGNILPVDDKQAGYLLDYGNDRWLPVLGSGYEALVLDRDGTALRPVSDADFDHVTHALVFRENMTNAARLMPFIRRHKARFIEIFLCSLVINLFALALPLFSSFVYDKILGNGITETLWALVIGLGIIIVVEFSIRMIRLSVAERFSIGSEADIDHTMFRNLIDARANAIPGIGSLLEKYKQILSYRDFLSSSYLMALGDVPFLFLFLAAIAVVAGPLAFVALACGLLLLAANAASALPVFDYDRQARRAGEHRYGLIADVLAAREAVIGSFLRDELSRRWRQSSVSAVTASSLARYWRGLGLTAGGSITYISYVGVLAGGVYMVEAHELTSGGLLAASMLTSRAMSYFSSITTLAVRYREFRTALRELNQIFPASARETTRRSFGRLQGAVRFDRVTCRLGQLNNPILEDISLNVRPGEMVGIAGAPGAGKTTLLRLVAGLLQPDSGEVFIDDIPVDKLSFEDMGVNIGFKPQDFCLLDGSIEDNVRAGRPALTAAAREEVLLASGLMRGFQESGLNWTTEIGGRGMNLSGGQRQMVALARAFLGNPPILLLDEPTNGLDAMLENHLTRQLAHRKGKCTMLISTHSRNLLSVCDRIIVVGQSRILADGPKDKILA